MDNKLTKKRLSDFLAYEWIFIIAISIVAILFWQLVFSISSIKLSVGQEFKYFYDENVTATSDSSFHEDISKAFSYDVRKVQLETLEKNYNVLLTRLSIGDGDAIFTDTKDDGKGSSRAEFLINTPEYRVIDLDTLLHNAKVYLTRFLSDTYADIEMEEKLGLATDFDKFSEDKIITNFKKRSGKRIYKNDLKHGVISNEDEIERIENLTEEVKYFERVLEYGKENGWLYASETDGKYYGIKMDKISDLNGEKNASDYFQLRDGGSADNVVLLIFNFSDKQEDLQYESIAFINGIIKKCSSKI